MTAAQTVTVLPEMLGRADSGTPRNAPAQVWDVHECAPVRGLPTTNIVDRKMVVPHGAEDLDRCIRAHEMMHAKVSPGADFANWINRGVASERAMRAVEEVRVNYLCNKAGFDVKKYLSDGGEIADGERCAIAGDWASAVYGAVAYMETASLNQFITGVRRHNPEWAAALRAAANRVTRLIKRPSLASLSDTTVHYGSGLSPAGFLHTERIAEFVDRIANPPIPEDDEAEVESPDGEPTDAENPDSDSTKEARSKTKPPVTDEQIKKMKPIDGTVRADRYWADLKPHRLPLNLPAPGGLGKRRSPTMVGRSPRRIERMLTDPHRRIFDRVTRGKGGVVLIDGSGSMHLNRNDVRRIVEAAPGATVAVYSANDNDHPVNLWILADRGRMVSEMPERYNGNGVDLPAIEWAIDQRQRSSSPVVWVTDGYVIAVSGSDVELDAFECMKVAIKNRVLIRPTVDTAIKALSEIERNRRPVVWWPLHWREVYKRYLGKPLPSAKDSQIK